LVEPTRSDRDGFFRREGFHRGVKISSASCRALNKE
jgi:hypothetical protein